MDDDNAEAGVLQIVARLLVSLRLRCLVVMGTVDKYADTRDAVALVVEVDLGGDIGRRAVLRLVGKPPPAQIP